ncbi:MAG: hypothetical protein ACJ741_13495 [Pyrinomonadaceae bacterium]
MNYRRYVLRLIRPAVLSLFVGAVCSTADGQYPPPVGPDSYRVDKTDISANILRNVVQTFINKVLADTNASLKAQGQGYHADLIGGVTFNSPYRTASENSNRPNQYYVKVPMNFTINISIPHTSDRQLHYPMELNVTCDGWQTGNGVVKYTAATGPPDIQGGNVIENLLQVRELIDGIVKSHLPSIGAQVQTFNNPCVTIGASPGNIEAQNSFIAWDAPVRRGINGVGAVSPHLEITFLRLKRLAARGNGQLLYAPVENVKLDAFANFDERQSQTLTFREGDVVTLNLTPVIINSPLPNVLVVIANIEQPAGSADDTTFGSATRAANFSPGEHTLQIPKEYVIPGGGPAHAKPSFGHTPGYELTYKVVSVNPLTISQPGRMP